MRKTCRESESGWHSRWTTDVPVIHCLGARYEYRADGLRVKKIADLTISWNPNDTEEGSGFYDEILSVNKPTTRYFYDGQMPMEEDFKITGGFGSPTVTVTQYGLGARGIEWIRNKVGNDPETIVFPIYDGHGNMVYTLSRAANETFSLGNKRVYGAWGDLRYDGNQGSGPNTQYCANLGHKLDGESGLTYMRARYYEPWTGRFISEDPARHANNWFIYCDNNPINKFDFTGKSPAAAVWITVFMLILEIALHFWQPTDPMYKALKNAINGSIFSFTGITIAMAALSADFRYSGVAAGVGLAVFAIVGTLTLRQLMLAFIIAVEEDDPRRNIGYDYFADPRKFTDHLFDFVE